ncbi:TPA: heme-binding protein [Pseudomonas aeruginosa]
MVVNPKPNDALYVSQALISHQASLRAMGAAIHHAETLGIKVVVAVVDSQGALTGFVRMPGAFLISHEMAIKKARSVAGCGITAAELEQVLNASGLRVREGLLSHPDLTLVRGGLPIRIDGHLIGAVAVSGGSEAEDEACAQAALGTLDLR